MSALFLLVLIHIVLAREPSMKIHSNVYLLAVQTGSNVSLDCSVLVPEGYFIGNVFAPGLSQVSWGNGQSSQVLTRNGTILDNVSSRFSAAHFSPTAGVAIFQLNIRNIQLYDPRLYSCSAPVTHVSGSPSTYLVNNIYLSIGGSLHDIPECSVGPDEAVLEDVVVQPTCFLARNSDSIVEWTAQYSDGSIETFNTTQMAQGVNYESYGFYFPVISKRQHNGVTFTCTIDSRRTCTTDALRVIAGPQIIGNNLLGANVGDTVSVAANIELPLQYYVHSTSWSKIIDSEYMLIVDNDTIRDDRVDPNRYDVQIVNIDGVYTSTLTIDDVDDSDTGYYYNYLTVTSDAGIGKSFLQFFRITVGFDLSETIPLCETRPEVPSGDDFFMYCYVKKGFLNAQFSWTRENQDGSTDVLDFSGSELKDDYVNYDRTYVVASNPFTDFANSVVRCTVSTPGDPDPIVSSCTFEQFKTMTTPTMTSFTTMSTSSSATTTEKKKPGNNPQISLFVFFLCFIIIHGTFMITSNGYAYLSAHVM